MGPGMTIDEALQRLKRSTGINMLAPPADPEWFATALERNAKEQHDRIAFDDHDLAMAQWWRQHRDRHKHFAVAPPVNSSLPFGVRRRRVLRWGAEVPHALAGYFQRRVCELARKHGVRLRWAPTVIGASAWSRFGAIEVPRPLTEELYARCLHEIGHVVTRDEAKRYRRVQHGSLDVCPLGECAAWRAARELAGRHDWTPGLQAELRYCLGTYLEHATPDEQRVMRALMADEGTT